MFLELLQYLFTTIFLSGVVSGGNFPEPLKESEERECLEKMRGGDKEARNKLIEHNLRLVAHIVKKYSQSADVDDLISIGTIGLMKGVDSFNYEKNTRLATYVSRCIENEILMHLRHEKKFSAQVSLSEPIGFDQEGNEINLMDVLIGEGEDICDKVDRNENIKRLIKKLNEIKDKREKEIIFLRYGLWGKKPLTQKEVAKRLGISRSYVSRIEKKAIADLKEI